MDSQVCPAVLVLKIMENLKSQFVMICWVDGILGCPLVDQSGEGGLVDHGEYPCMMGTDSGDLERMGRCGAPGVHMHAPRSRGMRRPNRKRVLAAISGES